MTITGAVEFKLVDPLGSLIIEAIRFSFMIVSTICLFLDDVKDFEFVNQIPTPSLFKAEIIFKA